jgi:hypothetical protein
MNNSTLLSTVHCLLPTVSVFHPYRCSTPLDNSPEKWNTKTSLMFYPPISHSTQAVAPGPDVVIDLPHIPDTIDCRVETHGACGGRRHVIPISIRVADSMDLSRICFSFASYTPTTTNTEKRIDRVYRNTAVTTARRATYLSTVLLSYISRQWQRSSTEAALCSIHPFSPHAGPRAWT